jgi:cation:H+ antiporter
MDLLVLALAFVVILVGAELFTNGIEWFGRKLQLAQGAVGSVLAAVGTALPETMIPVIAIIFGGSDEASHAVGVGAILGAPFMLSTLAMFVTGVGVIAFRARRPTDTRMVVDPGVLVHDIRYFVIAYALAVATAFLPPDLDVIRYVVAFGLIGIYAWYVKGHFDEEAEEEADELPPLRFHRMDVAGHRADPDVPRLRVVNVQVLVALVCIVGGAWLFVDAVEHLATTLGISELILALVIAPIATELPEKFNSLIWVRQGKDTLAMGNITGAMVFQSAFPTFVALIFAGSAWHISDDSLLAFLSAGITFLAVAAIFGPMWRRRTLDGRHLLVGGALYLLYLAIVGLALAGVIPVGAEPAH